MKISLNLPLLASPAKDMIPGSPAKSKTFSRAMAIADAEEADWRTGLDLDTQGTVLYRKKLFIEKSQRCKEKKYGKILINAGREKVVSAYLNGHEIDLSQQRPQFMAIWNLPFEYVFDQDMVQWDQENELTIRVEDRFEGSGIY